MEAQARGDRLPSVTVVPTGRLALGDKMSIACFLVVWPLWVLLWEVLPAPPRGQSALPLAPLDVLVLGGIIAAVLLGVLEIRQVRRIELAPSGVTFGFLLHREVRGWTELEPYQGPPSRYGEWWVISLRSRLGRAYGLTLRQARALLRHPSCLRWALAKVVSDGLGLPNDSSASGGVAM